MCVRGTVSLVCVCEGYSKPSARVCVCVCVYVGGRTSVCV